MMTWWCPVCGCRQPNESSLCSGSFLDTDHPSNVRPIESPPKETDYPDADLEASP